MKILLAEDSGFMRIAMERVLAKAGHNVTPVEDGQRAVCVARESVPDLVLLDLMLPKLTGPEVLEALKQDLTTKHIPVIVLTSLSQKNEAKLLQAGAAAYLMKSDKLFEDGAKSLLQLIETIGRPRAYSASQS